MSIVSIIVLLLVVALVIWLFESLIPIDATIKKLIYVVLVVGVLVWILNGTGVISGGPVIRLR